MVTYPVYQQQSSTHSDIFRPVTFLFQPVHRLGHPEYCFFVLWYIIFISAKHSKSRHVQFEDKNTGPSTPSNPWWVMQCQPWLQVPYYCYILKHIMAVIGVFKVLKNGMQTKATMSVHQCFLFQNYINIFFGYFDPESIFLDNGD